MPKKVAKGVHFKEVVILVFLTMIVTLLYPSTFTSAALNFSYTTPTQRQYQSLRRLPVSSVISPLDLQILKLNSTRKWYPYLKSRAVGGPNSPIGKSIDEFCPAFAERLAAFMKNVEATTGWRLSIDSGYRDSRQQRTACARGTGTCSLSKHQIGVAADFNTTAPNNRKALVTILTYMMATAHKYGLYNPLGWKDPAHFQMSLQSSRVNECPNVPDKGFDRQDPNPPTLNKDIPALNSNPVGVPLMLPSTPTSPPQVRHSSNSSLRKTSYYSWFKSIWNF